jgi:hypothetical protein
MKTKSENGGLPMIVTGDIKLGEPWGDSVVLQCPGCGQDYLHHAEVSVFDRGEDASSVIKTVVAGSAVTSETVPSEGSGNPSSRRVGLTSRFWCEHCTADPVLTIAQHKGFTLLAWRYRADAEAKDGPEAA